MYNKNVFNKTHVKTSNKSGLGFFDFHYNSLNMKKT